MSERFIPGMVFRRLNLFPAPASVMSICLYSDAGGGWAKGEMHFINPGLREMMSEHNAAD
jgi:hypothetical protein